VAAVIDFFIELAKETWATAWRVLKLIIPVTFIVKIIDLLGFIQIIAQFLAPVFELIGLPPSFGLVWTTTATANIYSGMYVFLNYTQQQTYTTAQVTVLSTMMLLAHSLLIELQVSRRVGVRRRFMLPLRVGAAFLAGYLLNLIFSTFHLLQQPNQSILPQGAHSQQFVWYVWLLEQLKNYSLIVLVIFGIMLMMKLLKLLGVIHFLQEKLAPAVATLGMGRHIIPMTIIGLLLGLVFGAALIINEKDQNPNIHKREFVYAMVLLGLCHAVVEDTLLVMGLGANIWGVLVYRSVFSFAFSYIFVRLSRLAFFRTKLKYITAK
jgi:spore maturation protein SpmB